MLQQEFNKRLELTRTYPSKYVSRTSIPVILESSGRQAVEIVILLPNVNSRDALLTAFDALAAFCSHGTS